MRYLIECNEKADIVSVYKDDENVENDKVVRQPNYLEDDFLTNDSSKRFVFQLKDDVLYQERFLTLPRSVEPGEDIYRFRIVHKELKKDKSLEELVKAKKLNRYDMVSYKEKSEEEFVKEALEIATNTLRFEAFQVLREYDWKVVRHITQKELVKAKKLKKTSLTEAQFKQLCEEMEKVRGDSNDFQKKLEQIQGYHELVDFLENKGKKAKEDSEEDEKVLN